MNINRMITPILVVLALVALTVWMSVFTITERETAVKLRFGEIVRDDYEPGLHFKLPIADRVFKYEQRIMTLDHRPERFLTVEKKNVIVDFFVKWRIEDVGDFYRATRGDMRQARERPCRLEQVVRRPAQALEGP
jgi:modulator of FtsH protease HflC